MIELTDEMREAVKGRMGIPRGAGLDPWMEAALQDVLALVERDHLAKPTCVCCGSAWPHVPSSERCAPSTTQAATADPLPFDTETVDPCTGCGHPENRHRNSRCAGDFMHCPCETWMPIDLEGRF